LTPSSASPHWTKSEISVRLRLFLKIHFSNFFLHPALPHTGIGRKIEKVGDPTIFGLFLKQFCQAQIFFEN
jgi:hypothetical protein